MKSETFVAHIRLAWWFWPVIAICYPLIWFGALCDPERVAGAVERIVAKAVRVKARRIKAPCQ